MLKRILHSKLPQVIISTADLDGRMKANEKDSMLTRLLDSQVQSGQSYENRSHPEYDLEEAILKIWCEHLGYEQIGIHDNFFDLGASSLDLIQVRLKIIEKLNIGIGIVDIYTHTTISSLCKFLTGRQEVEIKQEEVVTAGQIGERGKNRLQQRKRQIRGGN
ncbi:phosphopantetheine-binding protein [Paenibacillus larvae]|nr:phosphopantetheine-binding protein [Paenibacillus larvae]MDT2236992.1 phosphopantetheine-binding protein [Paenibacillus larvae]MDT2241853.1 phosphopantetheine-binding protein [Paenibacillus larvae]MDT2247655.1 phosphopantetheine-binding protein [Paenibacillus larvae]MDT2260986.1 phosphopantetheine-binding protein [Paenibacillus larvae]MDT2305322.1 phosphopantetheine-binding protein [Paenibacillus larvae]